MGVVTTLLRLVGGVVGERVGSSLGDRIERSFVGGSDEAQSEESDDVDEAETDESESEPEEVVEEIEAETESGDESVAERVTNALDSVTGGADDEPEALGDLDAMSDEDLQELAETLVNELNRRSKE